MQTVVDKISEQQIAEFEEAAIGYLVWYTVPGGCQVTLGDWLALVANTEVSDMVPRATRAVDAFKQAVARAKGARKFEYAKHGGQIFTYKFLPRDAGFDSETYIKALVVEELDSQRHSLSHETIVDLIFDRANERILPPRYHETELAALPEEIQESVRTRIHRINQEFHAAVRCLNPAKIRTVIQDELKWTQGAVVVREAGGVYFVPSRSRARLMALDRFVNALEGPSMHLMPILDTDRQRVMIREAFESEVTNATDSLMTELTAVLKGEAGTLTQKRAQGYVEQYQRMHAQMEEYTGILGSSLSYAETRLSLLHAQVMEMFSHIK